MENKGIQKIEDKEGYLKRQTTKIIDSCPSFTNEQPLFQLNHVSFTAKKKEILKDITLQIPRAGRTILLGENGCGKTTLLNLIARLEKLSGGEITQYLDERFQKRKRGSKAWFRKVGVVYQNPDYQLFMPSVEKEIEFGADSKEYASHIAELFHIKHLFPPPSASPLPRAEAPGLHRRCAGRETRSPPSGRADRGSRL